jgi:hypothetical protein
MSEPRDFMNVPTLLLEIFERLGGIDQQLKSGAATHAELKASLTEVNDKLGPLEDAAATVKRLEPIVSDYEHSKYKTIGVFLTFSGVASGLGFFASEIKSWFFKH